MLQVMPPLRVAFILVIWTLMGYGIESQNGLKPFQPVVSFKPEAIFSH